MNKYINKKTVGGAFLILLLLLIFFSRTIYGFYLPVVTAVSPKNGRLSKTETATGLVDCAETVHVYAALSGQVAEVLAEVGDVVAEGQPLFRLQFDPDEAERKLKELSGTRTKLTGDLQGIQMNLQNVNWNIEKLELSMDSLRLREEKTRRYRDELAAEVYELEAVSSYEYDTLALDIAKAESDLESARLLFELGEASAREVERTEAATEALYLRRANLEKTMAEQTVKNRKALEEKEKSREGRLLDYEADLASIALDMRSLEIDLALRQTDLSQRELDLRAKQIELDNLALQEEVYQKALRDFAENITVAAPCAGVVTAVVPAAGEYVTENRLIASVGVSEAYVVTCNVSLDNNFILPGDVCELTNATRVLRGTVTKVEPETQSKAVTVLLDDYTGAVGETFDLTFKKESATTYTLVPNGAVNQDNDGYYLNQIKRRDGMLGKEYYLSRLDVYVGDSDAQNTVILQGVTFFEPIVLLADQTVKPGDVITLKNASDFFE